MAQEHKENNKQKNIEWKLITSIPVFDGRQYENDHQFNQKVNYHINPIGNYIGNHDGFEYIPKSNQFPKLISNPHTLINSDLNKGFKQVCKNKLFIKY